MGWFLTTKKSSRASGGRKAARSSAASPKPWDPKRTLLGVKILLGVGASAGAVVGWVYGEAALKRYAIAMHGGDPVSVEDVVLADAPAWMSPEVRTRVATVVATQVDENPLDGRSLKAAARALGDEPWVAGVERVRRLSTGQIEVRADYRQPMAIVEGRDGYHLVDDMGVRLPGLYYRDQIDRLHLPLITGVAAAPPGKAGQKWPGDDLQAGLELVKLLAGEGYASQIKAYDVAERDHRGRIRLALQTERGLVRWGLPPGQEQTVEPPAATKMGWLRKVNQARGGIDAGGKIVDVYGASVQVSEPAMNEGPGGAYVFVNERN